MRFKSSIYKKKYGVFPVLTILFGFFSLFFFANSVLASNYKNVNSVNNFRGGSDWGGILSKIYPKPDGIDKYFVYIADGLYNPLLPNPNPEITGCDFTGFCDGDFFQRKIMGRDDYEIAEMENKAKKFFAGRFGVYVDDPSNVGRIIFRNFMIDPRFNYRVIATSGQFMPSKGWRVRDGGWVAIVIDPNGFELGGEFSGQLVPAGTTIGFGEYNIEVTPDRLFKYRQRYYSRKKNPKPIILSYQSAGPQVPGSKAFLCDLQSDVYGGGVAQGRVDAIASSDDGQVKLNAVNVITFPGL